MIKKMATFQPNPNKEKEIWIERPISEDLNFRIWHLLFFCFSGVIVLVVLICCCIKIRVPRTKQEIEADYQRKKITIKFREKLKLIQNQEMDAMDLKRALEIIQEDLRKENQSIDQQYLGKSLGRDKAVTDNWEKPSGGNGNSSELLLLGK